ncbi:MAG: ClbS/DfsB family four-helix bundle protein [Anaerolineaceae bacterium]|nr:ClbS/DfsB family four-helix bundle protein [Anaerolineaceae bacterium]
MMTDKTQILAELRDEFNRWETILAGLAEAQITAPTLPSNWSVKDVMAHLWAWQGRTIARLEAALYDREPEFPRWPEALDPEIEAEPDQLNTWLYESNREKSWPQMYGEWKSRFLRVLELAEAIPENDLNDSTRYAWLEGHSLAFIVQASGEHHAEHRDWLLPYLD